MIYFFIMEYLSANINDEKKLRRIQSRTQRHLDWYARDGLRTLCIAKKASIAFIPLFTLE